MAWSPCGSNDRKYLSLTRNICNRYVEGLILKSSLKHRRKHVLRPLQLCGDQALVKDKLFHLIESLQSINSRDKIKREQKQS